MDFGEEENEEKEEDAKVGGFPVYRVSTARLADGTNCTMGAFSFCARPRDFGIVLNPNAATGECLRKIVEPTPLGKYLMEQNKMGFFCAKVNKSCGMTLSIGVEIEGKVYGVFRDTGTEGRKPQSLGINVDFIPNCIIPLHSAILNGSIEEDAICPNCARIVMRKWKRARDAARTTPSRHAEEDEDEVMEGGGF